MQISREQGHCIKGLARLLIMVHNFVDILLDISSNEMVYSQKATDAFMANLFTADAFWCIISFAGWIGVPLFFFMSGYGLTKKYGTDGTLVFGAYFKNHVFKLWKLLVPVFLVYTFIYRTNIQSVIAQITFTINFLSYGKNGFYIDPGVYWFFGAILQFYLLFVVFRKLSTRWLWVLCAVFLAVHYCFLYFGDKYSTEWIRHNFLGWGMPFILGMIAARSKAEVSKRTNLILCVASFIALCACLVIKWLTPFTEVSIIVFLVTLARMFTMKWACFIGVISPSIFVLHPLIRMLMYSICFKPEYVLVLTLAYIPIVIISSWIHHILLNKLDNFKLKPKA